MTADTYNKIKSIADSYGVPVSVWYPIAMVESGGNPTAQTKTSQEDSRGIFQINTYAHPEVNSSQLFDVEYNAKYIMPTLKEKMDEGTAKGLKGSALTSYVEKYGERPQWTQAVQDNINKYYTYLTGNELTTGDLTETTTSNSNSIFDKIKIYLINAGVFILLLLCIYLIFGKGGK